LPLMRKANLPPASQTGESRRNCGTFTFRRVQ
jgi:hypothetical protein